MDKYSKKYFAFVKKEIALIIEWPSYFSRLFSKNMQNLLVLLLI